MSRDAAHSQGNRVAAGVGFGSGDAAGVAADAGGRRAAVAGAVHRGVTAPQARCDYCGGLFHASSNRVSFCSRACSRNFFKYGGKSKEAVAMVDPKKRAPQPKGCATVEEFFAAGGYVFRMPAVEAAQ